MNNFNPELDLVLERTLAISPVAAWDGWTRPELIRQWFCPRPWRVAECELDLRPGGIFRTVFRSPEGQDYPNLGCVLEAVAGKSFSWTNALLPGFRPAPVPESAAGFLFTATVEFSQRDGVTGFRAVVRHANRSDRDRHAEMGFESGWSVCADQLEELMTRV